MYKTKQGKVLNLSSAKEIAAGGEGKIFEHPTSKKKVVKIYHQPRKADFAKHLLTLSKLGPAFVKPQEIYYTTDGKVAGFDMDYVNFNNYWLFNNLFNKGFCTANSINTQFKINVLQHLQTALDTLHASKIIVGDLNMYNIFVSKKGEVLFVDVDSYQTETQSHSGVLLDEIRDWTTLDINERTDAWAYDILAFWATTFCHPFKWVVPGNKESIEQRVKNKKSYLSPIPGIKIPALYEAPKGEVERQFRDVFASGRRYMVNFSGAHVPTAVVVKQPVTSTSLEIREILTNVTHMNAATKFIAVRKKDGKWLFIETKIPKVTRTIKEVTCDEMYPSDNNYWYRLNNELHTMGEAGTLKDWSQSFNQPEFFYSNGSLVVFDYGNDSQINYNLANATYAIDSVRTPIFTKSVVVRDAPIQNFGNMKYLNVPNGNKYQLINVPKGVKNAYHVGRYVAVEATNKSKVEYFIFCPFGQGLIDFDYLPHFAVKNDLIFVPENGHIDVYKDFKVITTLDASICTRDSKLYSTDSGIMLLENNTLYLLNTK